MSAKKSTDFGLVSSSEAALIVGVEESNFRKWVGKLIPGQKVGQTWVFQKKDVLALKEQRQGRK